MDGRSTWFPRRSLWRRRSALRPITRRPVPQARSPRSRACARLRNAEDPFTFAITQRALALVGSGLDTAHMDLLVAAYVFKLLSHVGYRPDFSACVLCGDPMLSYFSPQAGGLMCGSCASSVPGAELVSTGEVAWLRALMSMTFDALMAERIDPHTAAFFIGAFACLGCDARRSAPPCDGIHVGSVMMRRRGLLVVTYRPVGTSILDARSTGGFPVRGE